MRKGRNFFAQNKYLDPKLHRSKYFSTFEEAKAWLDAQGGGTIKKRDAKVIHGIGYGAGRIDYYPPLRVWGEVYDSESDEK